MFFLCAGAAPTSKAKAKAKAKAKTPTRTTPKSGTKATSPTKKVLKISLKRPAAEELEDYEDYCGGQAARVMLDGKEVLVTRKDRRDHMAMLQTSQAIHECAKLVEMSMCYQTMCAYAMPRQQF